MLWYKAWLETRSRFLISLLGIVALPCFLVFEENADANRHAPADWYFHVFHNGLALIVIMWLAAVILLMMGGMLREKANGTASFTLALPVSRAHLMLVRIFSGFIQAMALMVVPWCATYLVAITTGKAASISHTLSHAVLFGAGGLVFFSIAVLVSSVVEGEYTAPAVTFGLLFADIAGLGQSRYSVFSIWNLMTGTEYLDIRGSQLAMGIPWPHVFANILVAVLLTAASIRAIQLREF
jgi:ABC-2 type transport system permease protein